MKAHDDGLFGDGAALPSDWVCFIVYYGRGDMNRHDIEKNLELLGKELHKRRVTGELVIAGGAMMLLLVQNRTSTQDVDAYFLKEVVAIREAAQVVARRRRLPTHWLNDAMKGFFESQATARIVA